jgi:hypothetical protein
LWGLAASSEILRNSYGLLTTFGGSQGDFFAVGMAAAGCYAYSKKQRRQDGRHSLRSGCHPEPFALSS